MAFDERNQANDVSSPAERDAIRARRATKELKSCVDEHEQQIH